MKTTAAMNRLYQAPNQQFSDEEDECDFGDTDECVIAKPQAQTLTATEQQRSATPNSQSVIAASKQYQTLDRQSQNNAPGGGLQISPSFSSTQKLMNSQNQGSNTTKNVKQAAVQEYQVSNQKQKQQQLNYPQGSMLVPSTEGLNQNFDTRQSAGSHKQRGLYQSKSQANFHATVTSNDPHDPENEQDFNKAYMKLVQKVYNEQGNNLLITQDELQKVAYTQHHLSVSDFNQRTQQSLENKSQKTRMLQEMKKQAEMQECTFKPQTYSQKQKRNFDQFLKDQAMYEEQRRKKKQDRLEQTQTFRQQEQRHQPQVNKKSAKIVEDKKLKQKQQLVDEYYHSGSQHDSSALDKPVYERLHHIHQEKLQNQVKRAMEQSQPRGLKKTKSEVNFGMNGGGRSSARDSGKPIEETLYEDAKRRWEKQEQKKKEMQRIKEEAIQATKPPTGNKNNQYATQKFEKEFYYMVHIIMSEGNDQEQREDFNLREYDEKQLNYMKLGQLVTDLGYIPANVAPDSVERELLFDMWNMLSGEENNGISVINAKKLLLAVHGISLDLSMPSPYQSQNDERHSSLMLTNFDDNGTVRLTQQEVSKIFIKFKPLYVNRVHHMGQYKRVKHVDNGCTFRPQLSKTTEQLAIQRRQRILSETRMGAEEDQNIMSQHTQDASKVDLVSLLLHPVHTDHQWRENAKQMLKAKELEECTFKPRILTNRSKSRLSGVNDKCLELYMIGKQALRERRDKTKDEFDFEKGKEECTFQPNIEGSQKNMEHLYYTSNQLSDTQYLTPMSAAADGEITQHIPGYQMAMARMKKGRDDRDKVKAMTARGIPGTNYDESQMQPLHIKSNQNYKGQFSTFQHNLGLQNNSQINNTTSTMSKQKSSENLLRTQSAQSIRRQSQKATTQAKTKRAEKENVNLSNSTQSANMLFKQSQQQPNQELVNKSYERGKIVIGGGNATANTRYSDLPSNTLDNQGKKCTINSQVDFDYEENIQRKHSAQHQHHQQDSDLDSVASQSKLKQPLLYVDVNLGPGKSERIIVYDGDTAESLAEKFSVSHGLDLNMKGKLAQLLDSQIAGLLEKIDEEQNSVHSCE